MNPRNASFDRAFLFVLQGVIGFMWAWAGSEKLAGDGGAHFAAQMAAILGFFASKNPHPWYQDFLRSVAIPNADAFGYLVAYGETLTGLVLLGASIGLLLRSSDRLNRFARAMAVAALLAAAAMNANYWLASGWISISDDRINILMGLLELVLVVANAGALATRLAPPAPQRGHSGRATAAGYQI